VSHTFGPTLQWDTTAGFSMFSQNLIYSTNGKNDIMNSILHINGYPLTLRHGEWLGWG